MKTGLSERGYFGDCSKLCFGRNSICCSGYGIFEHTVFSDESLFKFLRFAMLVVEIKQLKFFSVMVLYLSFYFRGG